MSNWFNLPEAIADVATDAKIIIRQLLNLRRIVITMATRLEKIQYLKSQVISLSGRVADLTQQLADEVADDAELQLAADTAKAEAEAAKAALAPLQEAFDADVAEDAGIDAELADVEVPAPVEEPTV